MCCRRRAAGSAIPSVRPSATTRLPEKPDRRAGIAAAPTRATAGGNASANAPCERSAASQRRDGEQIDAGRDRQRQNVLSVGRTARRMLTTTAAQPTSSPQPKTVAAIHHDGRIRSGAIPFRGDEPAAHRVACEGARQGDRRERAGEKCLGRLQAAGRNGRCDEIDVPAERSDDQGDRVEPDGDRDEPEIGVLQALDGAGGVHLRENGAQEDETHERPAPG